MLTDFLPYLINAKFHFLLNQYKNRLVTNDELIYSNMLQTEALLRVLIKRGITTKDEVMDEVKLIQVEMQEKIKKNSLEN